MGDWLRGGRGREESIPRWGGLMSIEGGRCGRGLFLWVCAWRLVVGGSRSPASFGS